MLGRETELGGAGGDCGGDIGAFAFLDIDIDVGIFAQERGQCLRQMLRQDRGIGQHMHAGLGAGGIGTEIAAHRIDLMHDDAGMIEQAFARRGQFDAAPAALEQCHAERLFQSLDARAGGRQRQMDLQRAAGDTARIGHRDEQLQVNQVEPHRALRYSSLRSGRRQIT